MYFKSVIIISCGTLRMILYLSFFICTVIFYGKNFKYKNCFIKYSVLIHSTCSNHISNCFLADIPLNGCIIVQ